MPVQNGLYSFRGSEPTLLPHRITLSDGSSRTDSTTFTDEELADAGYTGPYVQPNYDLNTQILVWNSDSLTFSVEERIPQIQSLTEEQKYEFMRYERNKRLQSSDWTLLLDSPLTDEEKNNWIQYRQNLRDLPANIEDIDNIVWPVSPIEPTLQDPSIDTTSTK
jgi:hypothetical protein